MSDDRSALNEDAAVDELLALLGDGGGERVDVASMLSKEKSKLEAERQGPQKRLADVERKMCATARGKCKSTYELVDLQFSQPPETEKSSYSRSFVHTGDTSSSEDEERRHEVKSRYLSDAGKRVKEVVSRQEVAVK